MERYSGELFRDSLGDMDGSMKRRIWTILIYLIYGISTLLALPAAIGIVCFTLMWDIEEWLKKKREGLRWPKTVK
ncbi:MAG: hypothetical protein ACTSRC_21980 [Candidatus Helarchaeota archaeon]